MSARREQDPLLPRSDVLRALNEQPRLYITAKASLPNGTGPHVRLGSHRDPPVPINVGVHDLIEQAEWQTLQLNGRLRLVLGWSQPWGRMHDACPFCRCWSLHHNAARGVIRCANPECRTPDGNAPVWRDRAGWLELAALLAAADQTIDQGESA